MRMSERGVSLGIGVSPHSDVSFRPLSPGKGLVNAKVMSGDAQVGRGRDEAQVPLCHLIRGEGPSLPLLRPLI